jgi:hemerythrin-like domain-containing protein
MASVHGMTVARARLMKATDLLKAQHKEVAKLFKAIESSEDAADKEALFLELASKLTAHDGIEREIFYPACEEAMGLNDLLGEALVEHGVIEFSLYQCNEALGQDDFDFKCTVLQELVEHHVEEEEKELFPEVEKELGKDSLELLGTEMEEAFQAAVEADFRGPLYENLRQVLAGALETSPAKSQPAAAKKAPAKAKPKAPSKKSKSA